MPCASTALKVAGGRMHRNEDLVGRGARNHKFCSGGHSVTRGASRARHSGIERRVGRVVGSPSLWLLDAPRATLAP